MTEEGSLMDLIVDDSEHSGLLNFLSDWGYYAYMKLKKGEKFQTSPPILEVESMPLGLGMIFYRIFKHLWPKRLEMSKDQFEFEEWWDRGYRILGPEEAEQRKPGDIVYFSPGYHYYVADEERIDPTKVKEKLNFDTEKPYEVEYVEPDFYPPPPKGLVRLGLKFEGVKNTRVKVKGINRLFLSYCFGRKD